MNKFLVGCLVVGLLFVMAGLFVGCSQPSAPAADPVWHDQGTDAYCATHKGIGPCPR